MYLYPHDKKGPTEANSFKARESNSIDDCLVSFISFLSFRETVFEIIKCELKDLHEMRYTVETK